MFVTNEVIDADEVGSTEYNDKSIEKSGKLSKNRKLSKFWKLAKFKKPLKSRNLPNFNAKEVGPNFLISDVREAYNCLWLSFIKVLILWYNNPEFYIWIKTKTSGYAIEEMRSQLTSGTNFDLIITKANLSQWHLVAFFFKKIILAEI